MAKNNYIYDLISEGEHQRLDFKFAITDSKKIARSLSAFANTDGGILLIGVKDNGQIAGIRSEEEYYMIEAAAEMYCTPKVEFKAKEWNIEGKIILEITVDPSPNKPHKSPHHNDKLCSFIRINDENVVAPEVIEMAWKKIADLQGTHIRISAPVERLLKYLEVNSTISLNQFKKIGKVNYLAARRILSDLIAIGALGYKMIDKKIVYGTSDKQEK